MKPRRPISVLRKLSSRLLDANLPPHDKPFFWAYADISAVHMYVRREQQVVINITADHRRP